MTYRELTEMFKRPYRDLAETIVLVSQQYRGRAALGPDGYR
jgi:hypothetical protein